jgi:hypothetical protein
MRLKFLKYNGLMMILLFISYKSWSQKGVNIIQPSIQLNIPTGNLADNVNVGYGAGIKGMLGVGKVPQHLTLEVGYNRFGVKNLPSSVDANYSSIPAYFGYRARLGGLIIESQAGVAFNHIEASGPLGTVSSNQTSFGWAISAGYVYRNVELDVKYQNSESENDTYAIRFVGIRLAYNFSIK